MKFLSLPLLLLLQQLLGVAAAAANDGGGGRQFELLVDSARDLDLGDSVDAMLHSRRHPQRRLLSWRRRFSDSRRRWIDWFGDARRRFGDSRRRLTLGGFFKEVVSVGFYERRRRCATGQLQRSGEGVWGDCSSCAQGKFQDQGQHSYTSCKSCGAGQFVTSAGQASCTACRAGSAYVNAATACKSCPSGKYTADGSACKLCPGGKFASSEGSSSCTDCGAGSFQADAGQASCAACPAGKFAAGKTHSACGQCSSGKFASSEGSSSCTDCGAGSFQADAGQASCAACPAGQFAAVQQSTGCSLCAAGKFVSQGGQTLCGNCAAGRFQAETGRTACQACPAGKYSIAQADSYAACSTCSPGTYGSAEKKTRSADACKACPSCTDFHRFRDGCGGGSMGDCLECSPPFCPSGQYRSEAGTCDCKDCTSCERGFVATGCSEGSRGTCTPCNNGEYHDVEGSTVKTVCKQCEACPAGEFRDGCATQEGGKCVACPGGSYKSEGSGGTWNTPCVACATCPAGKILVGCGAGASGTCTDCPTGQFSVLSGSTGCSSCAEQLCPAGKFRDKCGSAIPRSSSGGCAVCEKGKYTSRDGYGNGGCESCPNCPAGKFRAPYEAAATKQCASCKDCPKGKYVDAVSGTHSGCKTCRLCSGGSKLAGCYRSFPGTCEQCAFGLYQNVTAGDGDCGVCAGCGRGEERFGCLGNSSGICDSCAAGRYKVPGQSKWYDLCEPCVGCSPGFRKPTFGDLACGADTGGRCTACPEGQYKDQGVDALAWDGGCKPCETCASEGFFLRGCGGASRGNCTALPAGKYYLGTFPAWNTSALSCAPCIAGQFRRACGSASAGVCLLCPRGKFKSERGAYTTPCVTCGSCDVGFVRSGCASAARNSSGLCSPSGVGRYKATLGAWNTTATACDACPAAYFRKGCGGASGGMCAACPVGKYKPARRDDQWSTPCLACRACEAGEWRVGCGNTTQGSCEPCATGRYKERSGSHDDSCAVCEPCRPTQFRRGCSAVNAGTCTTCPRGKFKDGAGAWNKTCVQCPVGHYCVNGQTVPCQKGSYLDEEGASRCKLCLPGRFGSDTALSSATCSGLCSAGYLCAAGAESKASLPCGEIARYCPAGSSSPLAVGAGNFSVGGSDERTRTGQRVCGKGHFCQEGVQEQCPQGYYCPAGASSPVPCGGAASYCPEGSVAPLSVARGNFSAGGDPTSRSEQAICTAGSACVMGVRTPCPKGRYQNAINQTSCELCPPGRLGSNMGEIRPLCAVACPSKHYCPRGTAEATECPEGTFCPEESARPGPVKAGFWVSYDKQVICPASFFCQRGELQACLSGMFCPPGSGSVGLCDEPAHYCPNGAVKPEIVPPGWESVGKTIVQLIAEENNRSAPPAGNGSLFYVDRVKCSAPSHFCQDGEKLAVREAFYTDSNREREILCEAGFYCVDGERYPCRPGHFCPIGTKEEKMCGGFELFCDKARMQAPTAVSDGYYSTPIGGNETTRTGQQRCEPGYACVRGKRELCDPGSYCMNGIQHHVDSGYYAANPDNAVRPTTQFPCACDLTEQLPNCTGHHLFYCIAGERRNITVGKMPVFKSQEGGLVQTFRECEPRRLCAGGIEQPCPLGKQCAEGLAKDCPHPAVGVDGECVLCSIGAWNNGTACRSCASRGVDCKSVPGARTFLPGWWRNANRSGTEHNGDDFYKCLVDADCIVDSKDGAIRCGDGVDTAAAPLCAACKTDYTKFGERCVKCPAANAVGYLLASLAILAVMVVLGFVLKAGLKNNRSTKQSPVSTMKIFANYLYMASLLSLFDIPWTKSIRTMQDSASLFSGAEIPSAKCFFGGAYAHMIYLYLSLPLVAFLLPALILAGWAVYRYCSPTPVHTIVGVSPERFARNSVLVLMYTWWPTVAKRCFEALTCSEPIEGRRHLEVDYREVCYDGAHAEYSATAWFVLLTFVPAFPCLCFYVLRKHRHELEEQSVQERYIFLYSGFRGEMPYWEIVVMARKVTFAGVIAGFKNDVLQPYVGMCILFVCLFLHVHYKPYRIRDKQGLETVVLSALLLSLLLGWSSQLTDINGKKIYDMRMASCGSAVVCPLSAYGISFSVMYVLLHTTVVVFVMVTLWIELYYDAATFGVRFRRFPSLVSLVGKYVAWAREGEALQQELDRARLDVTERDSLDDWSIFGSPGSSERVSAISNNPMHTVQQSHHSTTPPQIGARPLSAIRIPGIRSQLTDSQLTGSTDSTSERASEWM